MTSAGAESHAAVRVPIAVMLLRLLLFGVMLAVLYFGLQMLAALVIRSLPASLQMPVPLVLALLICLVMVLAYRLAVRLIERRHADELAIDAKMPLILPGLLIGLALFACVCAVLWLAGGARYGGIAGTGGLIVALAMSIMAGFAEEIIVRGGVFRVVEDGFGTLAALIVSSVLFGGAHALNPSATLISSAAITLEAGVLLGLAYTASRSLWFPIGIHCGWNFAEGGIFGAPVSGHQSLGIFKFELSGPSFLTGGAFGPEASAVSVGICLVAAAAIGVAAVRLRRWRTLRDARG